MRFRWTDEEGRQFELAGSEGTFYLHTPDGSYKMSGQSVEEMAEWLHRRMILPEEPMSGRTPVRSL